MNKPNVRLPLMVLLGWGLSLSGTAQALALYDAFALGELLLVNKPDPVGIGADARVLDQFAAGDASVEAVGEAMVAGADPFDLTAGDAVLLEASAFGSAVSGTAFSSALTDAFITLDNSSADSQSVGFEFSWAYGVTAFVDDPALELALADIVISVESALLGTVFEIRRDADTDLGNGPFSDTDLLSFAIPLAAGQSDTLSLTVSSFGAGEVTAVPVPTTLALLGLGVAGFGYRRCRNPQARS